MHLTSPFHSSCARAGLWACGLALLAGCDALDPPDDPVEFRDNFCGAKLKWSIVEQTCTFKPKVKAPPPDDPYSNFSITGTCDGDDKLDCKFVHTGCTWEATNLSVCKTLGGQCALPPDPKPQLLKTYDLDEGDQTCDSVVTTGVDKRTLLACRLYAGKQLFDGKTALELLNAKCLAQVTDDVKSKAGCCISKAPVPPMTDFTTGMNPSTSDSGGDSTSTTGWMTGDTGIDFTTTTTSTGTTGIDFTTTTTSTGTTGIDFTTTTSTGTTGIDSTTTTTSTGATDVSTSLGDASTASITPDLG